MLRSGVFVCSALLLTNIAAAVSVHVDIEPTSGTTAAGYDRLLTTNRFDTGTFILTTDAIQVGWKDGSVTQTYVRTDSTDALLMDATQYGVGVVGTVLVKNLPAGQYSVTVYGYDTTYKDKLTQFDFDGNGDGTPDVSATIDNHNSNQSSATVSVDVSSAGVLAISAKRPDGSSRFAAFNGLDIGPAEPDTTAPAAVTDLATAAVDSQSVSLHWTAPLMISALAVRSRRTTYAIRPVLLTPAAGHWRLPSPPVPRRSPVRQRHALSVACRRARPTTSRWSAVIPPAMSQTCPTCWT